MFPLMIPMLIGAAGGALMNKKDPLKGALLGGGLGAAGGLLAPAALGGGATAGFGGAAAGSQAGMLAAQEAGLGASSLGWGGATTGVQGGLNSMLGADMGMKAGGILDTASSVAKPASTAMQTASMFQQPEEPMPAPPPLIQPQGGAQTLNQLATNNQQMALQQQQMTDARREAQKQRIARMGGLLYG